MGSDEIGEVLARIEQRQAAFELVAHRILERLEVQTAQIGLLVEAASQVPDTSPVATALLDLFRAVSEQTAAIESLHETLGDLIAEGGRVELQEEGFDPDQPAGGVE